MLKTGTNWTFSGNESERTAFGSLDATLAIHASQGTLVSKDPISSVKRVDIGGVAYYIKQYSRNGKRVRRFFGRGRLQGEWENLLYFASLGIPTPRLIAYGQQFNRGQFESGALITEEIPNSSDLATLAKEHPQLLTDRRWLMAIMRQVADYTQRLHQQGFIHWDLKWRNILIENGQHAPPEVYFFDCPLGRQRQGWLRSRGIIKDLACLDKVGRKMLSRTQRMKFFHYYRFGKCGDRFTGDDKVFIRKIVNFF